MVSVVGVHIISVVWWNMALVPSVCFSCRLLFFLKLVLCCFWPDPIFELKVEQKDVLMEALQQPWQVQEKAMDTDISALQWVEDLEQRVVAADLHMKVRIHLCHYFPYVI